MARRRNKGEEKRIARSRVRLLLARARAESLGSDPDLADRYAALARRVGMRYQSPMLKAEKLQLCKGCDAYRVPGRTSRTRLHGHRLITTCLRCGRIERRPIHGA